MPVISDFVPGPPGWAVDWDGIDGAFAWIRRLRGSTQDPAHHAEGDVHVHTRMVAEEMAASADYRASVPADREVLFAAALLHDACKPETRAVDEDGRITNRGHSRAGAGEARRILWRMGMGFSDRERVSSLIAVHQAPFWLVERPARQAMRTLAASGLQAGNRLLGILAEADARGRACADKAAILDNVELFRMMARDAGCYDVPYPFFNDHSRVRFFGDPETVDPAAELYDTTDPGFAVTVASGLPGSGKSTLIARETAPGGSLAGQEVVSMDRMRAEMRVRPEDDQGAVRQAALKRARELLAARRPFVWDALNLDRQRRQPVARLCLDYGARVVFAYVEAGEDEMMARNRARPAMVPEAVIARMLRTWDPPTLAECHELRLSVPVPGPAHVPARRR